MKKVSLILACLMCFTTMGCVNVSSTKTSLSSNERKQLAEAVAVKVVEIQKERALKAKNEADK